MSSHALVAFEPPPFQGDILDEAGVLDQAEQEAMLQRIRELREGSGIWAAVYVAGGLEGDSIEEAANLTFRHWELGQAQVNNGLLVMVVPSERKMRIEVGYGLEGEITDAVSRQIIEQFYKPAFREGRFAAGLMAGFAVMEQVKNGEPLAGGAGPPPDFEMPLPEPAPMDWSRAGSLFLWVLGLNVLPALLFALAIAWGRWRKRGGEWKDLTTPLSLFGFFGAFSVCLSRFSAPPFRKTRLSSTRWSAPTCFSTPCLPFPTR